MTWNIYVRIVLHRTEYGLIIILCDHLFFLIRYTLWYWVFNSKSELMFSVLYILCVKHCKYNRFLGCLPLFRLKILHLRRSWITNRDLTYDKHLVCIIAGYPRYHILYLLHDEWKVTSLVGRGYPTMLAYLLETNYIVFNPIRFV